MVDADARAAESLNMQNEIGAIEPRMQADIIALDGNPPRTSRRYEEWCL
jgi:imidazolonepropionase-like amidohydrolase